MVTCRPWKVLLKWRRGTLGVRVCSTLPCLAYFCCPCVQTPLQVGPDESSPHCCCVHWSITRCSQEVEERRSSLVPPFSWCEEHSLPLIPHSSSLTPHILHSSSLTPHPSLITSLIPHSSHTSSLTPHIPHSSSLTHHIPCPSLITSLIPHSSHSSLLTPSLLLTIQIILFKLIGLLFPTSDYQHSVVTPAMLFMGQLLLKVAERCCMLLVSELILMSVYCFIS